MRKSGGAIHAESKAHPMIFYIALMTVGKLLTVFLIGNPIQKIVSGWVSTGIFMLFRHG